MRKLKTSREDYEDIIGYYPIQGSCSLDLIRLDICRGRALVSYFGSNDVFITDVKVKVSTCKDGLLQCEISIYDENSFCYNLRDFRLRENWKEYVTADTLIYDEQ